VEAPALPYPPVACRHCGTSLAPYANGSALKYFLVAPRPTVSEHRSLGVWPITFARRLFVAAELRSRKVVGVGWCRGGKRTKSNGRGQRRLAWRWSAVKLNGAFPQRMGQDPQEVTLQRVEVVGPHELMEARRRSAHVLSGFRSHSHPRL